MSKDKFKRAGRYEDLEEAMKDVPGSVMNKLRVGQARLDAQEAGKRVKKEREF